MVILHWAIPTLIIPAVAGNLISFNTQPLVVPPDTSFLTMPFDPLTAAIIRLAAQVGYPFSALDQDVQGLDVLGFRWRVLNAAVGLAFAFAEAIACTPQKIVHSLATQQQYEQLLENSPVSGSISIKRKAVMARGPEHDENDE